MRVPTTALVALAFVHLAAPGPTSAQLTRSGLEPPRFAVDPPPPQFAVDFQEHAALESGIRTIGLFGVGVLGSIAGGYAGARVGRSSALEDGMFTGARRDRVWVGALVGSVVGTTLTVHLFNGGRASIANPLAGALLGTAAGFGLAVASDDIEMVVPAVVVGQASLAAIFTSMGGTREASGRMAATPGRPFQTDVERQLGQSSGAPTAEIVLGASLGATVGALAGGWLGYQAGKGGAGEDPGLVSMVYGGVIGSGLGAPLGATIVASPEGSFASSLAGSLLAGLAGLGLGAAAGGELAGVFLAPVLEIIGATIMVRYSK